MASRLFSEWRNRRHGFGPNSKVLVERVDDGKSVVVQDNHTIKTVASVSTTKEIKTFPHVIEYIKGDHVNNKIINRSFGLLMDRPRELALSMKQVVWTNSKDFVTTYNSLVKLNKIIGPIKRNQFLRAILEMIMKYNLDYINYPTLGLSSALSIKEFWTKIDSGYSIIKAMFEFLARVGERERFHVQSELSKPVLKAMLRAPAEVNCRNKLIRFAVNFQKGGLDPSLLSGIPAHSWIMACHACGCPELVRAIILYTKNMTREEANKSVLNILKSDADADLNMTITIKEAIRNLASGINDMKLYYERQRDRALRANRNIPGPQAYEGVPAVLDLSKSTFTSLKRKVDEWHEMLNHQERDKQLLQWGNPDQKFPIKDIKEIKLLVDDSEFEVAMLKTPREMVEEGVVQQHCIAQYIPEAKACRSFFYGIRKGGKRIASAQVSSRGAVMQIKGYHNGPVDRHLEETFREWINLAYKVSGKNAVINDVIGNFPWNFEREYLGADA